MELRRQEPWVQADRIPPSVVAGNHEPSWAPPGACCSEGVSLRGSGRAFVAVADDNHHHRIPLLRALRAAGHEVLHAAGPRSCERLIQDSTHDIAALVCCTEMKEMSGFELARRVIQGRPDIRVLLVFRDDSDCQERDRASSLGYAQVLQSTSPTEICSRLARLLGSPDPRDRLPHSSLVASRD
jgi:CheY-like chemotaxis protein